MHRAAHLSRSALPGASQVPPEGPIEDSREHGGQPLGGAGQFPDGGFTFCKAPDDNGNGGEDQLQEDGGDDGKKTGSKAKEQPKSPSGTKEPCPPVEEWITDTIILGKGDKRGPITASPELYCPEEVRKGGDRPATKWGEDGTAQIKNAKKLDVPKGKDGDPSVRALYQWDHVYRKADCVVTEHHILIIVDEGISPKLVAELLQDALTKGGGPSLKETTNELILFGHADAIGKSDLDGYQDFVHTPLIIYVCWGTLYPKIEGAKMYASAYALPAGLSKADPRNTVSYVQKDDAPFAFHTDVAQALLDNGVEGAVAFINNSIDGFKAADPGDRADAFGPGTDTGTGASMQYQDKHPYKPKPRLRDAVK